MRREGTVHHEREEYKKPELLKDLAVAASLVVCAVTLRCGAIPGAEQVTDAVVTAMTGDTLLDEHLGRLTFVSKMFPEATLVFGEGEEELLVTPVTAEVVHTWHEQEPYMAWHAASALVIRAAMDGEVTAVARDAKGALTVSLRGKDGKVCVYGNLADAVVHEGDEVKAGETVGHIAKGEDIYFELREDGRSVDPSSRLLDP